MSAGGWIGVDLDATLARYDGWVHELHIGEPIAPMVERIKAWLAEGREVRIFTARVCEPGYMPEDRSRSTVAEITEAIQNWTEQHIGVRLPVTNIKDFGMAELWDDRAVRVPANSGHRCCNPAVGGLNEVFGNSEQLVPPAQADDGSMVIGQAGQEILAQCIAAHGVVASYLVAGRPDLALVEARYWVEAFMEAARIVKEDSNG